MIPIEAREAIYEEVAQLSAKIESAQQLEFALGLGLIGLIFILICYLLDHWKE